MDKDKILLIIPSLNPDDKLINLVEELKNNQLNNILIVNDGSKEECLQYFDVLKNNYNCFIFSHFKNLGKGRALKNAFNYALSNFDFDMAITLDADGQHKVEDVLKLAEKFNDAPLNSIGLGYREFKRKDVPFRSRFGNIFTRLLLKILCGINVKDTQTGLRAFKRETMKEFLDVKGERFEYEMNMILLTKQKNINIVEEPIQTVYLENNKSSHFNPVKDSFKIMLLVFSTFFKYGLCAIICCLIDIGLFYGFLNITKAWFGVGLYIIISTIFARIISSCVNFILNKKTVFKHKDKGIKFWIQYFVLVIINMVVSGVIVDVLVNYCYFAEVWAKVLIDGILFILNFFIQREFIFKNRYKKEEN